MRLSPLFVFLLAFLGSTVHAHSIEDILKLEDPSHTCLNGCDLSTWNMKFATWTVIIDKKKSTGYHFTAPNSYTLKIPGANLSGSTFFSDLFSSVSPELRFIDAQKSDFSNTYATYGLVLGDYDTCYTSADKVIHACTDFSYSNFNGVNYPELFRISGDFSHANFHGATLGHKGNNVSVFMGPSQYVDFSNAAIYGYILPIGNPAHPTSDCDLSYASFKDATIRLTLPISGSHTTCKLAHVNFENTSILYLKAEQVDFTGSDFSKIKGESSTYQPHLIFSGANLTEANFSGVDFTQFTPTWHYFYDDINNKYPTILTNANLSNTKLAGNNFGKVNMKGVNLSDADSANNGSTGFHQADLTDANLTGAKFTRASFESTNFTNANLSNADLSNANLKNAILTGAVLTGTNFSGATWTDGKKCKADSIGQCNK